MKCVIPGTGIRAFGKSVYCLAKIGDEIYIESSNNSLTLKTVNPARSGYACFEFKKAFFNSLECQCPVSCKLLSKSILSVFRGLSALEKSVDHCILDLNSLKDKMTFVFQCKYGIKKTHQLGFEDCEALRAVYNKESHVSRLTQCSKPFQEALYSFHNSVNEITLSVTPSHLQMSNYVDEHECSSGARVTMSNVTIQSDEFEDYLTTSNTTNITFCLKELRAILTFATALVDSLTLQFETAGKPVILLIEGNPTYTADFVLATLSADSESQQSQSHITQQSQSRITQQQNSSESTRLNSFNYSTPLSHTNDNISRQQPADECLNETDDVEMEVVPKERKSVSSFRYANTVSTQDDYKISPPSFINSVPSVLDTPTFSNDDFVNDQRMEKSQSLSNISRTHSNTSQDQMTQDSILDSSGFLPSTPPPCKKFKSIFSITDIFEGMIQSDSSSILAADSDDDCV